MSNALKMFMESKKDIPEIRYVLPGSQEELLLRPFTTKEQKAILKAIEKEDQILIGEAFDNLLKQCVISDKFKPETLLAKDRECLLIKLRQESVKESFSHAWKCEECGRENKKQISIEELKFKEVVEGSIKTKEIELDNYDCKLVLGNTTREDEKNILSFAKRNSGIKSKEISQTEILSGAYASVIKGFKTTEEKIVKNEAGEEIKEEQEKLVELSFADRMSIFDSLSVSDKNKIKGFFDELEEYGYDLNLGTQTCTGCSAQSEQELEWMVFFMA
jgi:hypothetical protein